LAPIFGKAIWLPGSEDTPKVRWTGKGTTSKVEMTLNVDFCADEKVLYGSGYYNSTGGMCPFDQMEGYDTEAMDFLNSEVSAVLGGSELNSYNPASFDRFNVSTGFKFETGTMSQDNLDRFVVEIGAPKHSIVGTLPGDIHIYQEKRSTPINIPGDMEQNVVFNIDVSDFELISIPESKKIENGAGMFELVVSNEDGKVKIERKLHLTKANYSAEEWMSLRALLLAESNANNRTLIFK